MAKLKSKGIWGKVKTGSAIIRVQNIFSVVLKTSHPLRPVIGQDAASLGPEAPGVKVRMPFQRPQLLDADLAHGPVHEQGVDKPAVAVDAEGPHPVTTYRGPGSGLIFKGRWGVCRIGEACPEGAIQHHGHIADALVIDVLPTLFIRVRTPGYAICGAVAVEAVAAGAVGMVGTVPGLELTTSAVRTVPLCGERAENLMVEAVDIVGKLLRPAAFPFVSVS